MHTLLTSTRFRRALSCIAAIVASLPMGAAAQECGFPCFDGGGIAAGLSLAGGIVGLLQGNPGDIINAILARVVVFLALAALVVITIAGIYLVLGLGEDSSRDKAKKIILYTAIGIFIVIFASVIVQFIFYLAGQTDTTADDVIRAIMARVLNFLALACVIVTIVAGLYLVLGLGDDAARDKAKKIIFSMILGLAIILLAQVIVNLLFYIIAGIGSDAESRVMVTAIVRRVLNFLALIAVVMVIVAGFYLVLSLGNDDTKDKAKKIIYYTIIGLVVVLFARVIVEATIYFFRP
jgi:hypothetical protein